MDQLVKSHPSRNPMGRSRATASTKPASRAARLRASEPAGAIVHRPDIDLGGLDQFTGYVVRRAQVWMFQDFKRVLKELDITPAQFSVMKIVAANPGIAQARVAEALFIERARLVQMLDRLEVAGLIRRARSSTDRRSHALHLTEQGARLLAKLEARIEQHERNVVARIGERGKRELLRLLAPFLRQIG
jgi:DNA-binding MarR family transcriptional regulator